MLPAAHRLRTTSQFRDTTRRGRKVNRGTVVVYVGIGSDDQPPRLGVITSKSVGGSVARHRAARRIRGAAFALMAELPRGVQVVVRALPGADRDPLLGDRVREGIEAGLRVTS